LLRSEIEEGGEAGECNPGVVFGDDPNVLRKTVNKCVEGTLNLRGEE
jgi:hypothetical protein